MTTGQESPDQLTFMAIHAHPDDEVFTTGGTFALLAERGVRTVLVTATGGEEGQIVDPALDRQAKEQLFPRLVEVRRKELEAAAEILHISVLHRLGYRDSGMARTRANNHPDSFHRVIFDEAVRRVVAIIREFRPQVIVTYDPFGVYGHPDHIQAHRVTVAAFEVAGDARCFPDLPYTAWQPQKLYYTAIPRSQFERLAQEMQARGVPGPWDNPRMNVALMGTADELITTRIDVSSYLEQKMRAFRAYRTQVAPDSFVFALPEEQRRLALGYEHFVLAHRPLPTHTGGLEQDLFAGL
ncbi:MAG: N-acetyl-1-D-myo-inositol-2-amino-2-deoxy-alpha-D-glucopyranoside deacetylase [Ktedonobacteraceae bacterium]|nr:N-acetyl-1-D-myo-inositol-2-amino-2-deoxy-alpha-D-glucopyranoside deacetylase [Ktedonobacteraceae bacterium]